MTASLAHRGAWSKKVVVAMSGGVDSTVAAFLLLQAGFRVIGVTLQLADFAVDGFDTSRCCSAAGVASARGAARRLGVPHVLLDVRQEFRKHVLIPFVESYLAGETPSPCVHCNSSIKFGYLLELARRLGADSVATGHYARLLRGPTGEWELRRAREYRRDQSYFLFHIPRERLGAIQFPLGEMTKEEVRALATDHRLPSANVPDSQDMCVVPRGQTYVGLLEHLAGERLPGGGEIVDQTGAVLGRHQGIHRFTVGQRRGLGLSSSRPLFVTRLDAPTNRVVVGEQAALRCRRIRVRGAMWLKEPDEGSVRAEVQVRSRHAAVPATLTPLGERVEVEFDDPVTAPSPGQAAVWYQHDRVLGGGWITAE